MDEYDLLLLKAYRDANGPIGPTALSRATGLSIGITLKHSKFLRRCEFIEYEKEPIFGRNAYKITEKGIQALAEVDKQ